MGFCGHRGSCGCAITSSDGSLSVGGSGTESSPYDLTFNALHDFNWSYNFANAGERDATILAPASGDTAWLRDFSTLWRHDGTGWKLVWAPNQWLVNSFVPGATDDAPTTPEASWLQIAVTIPSWATNAHIEIMMTNVDASAAGTIVYDLRARLGGVSAGSTARVQHDGALTKQFSWLANLSGFTTGAQNLEIMANRISGANVLRAATTTRTYYRIRWS